MASQYSTAPLLQRTRKLPRAADLIVVHLSRHFSHGAFVMHGYSVCSDHVLLRRHIRENVKFTLALPRSHNMLYLSSQGFVAELCVLQHIEFGAFNVCSEFDLAQKRQQRIISKVFDPINMRIISHFLSRFSTYIYYIATFLCIHSIKLKYLYATWLRSHN